ncbi:MAG: HEPN domain-containing protein [Cyanobacteria bacterium]|nr:HEPN domain-containing protein [Cyanobacteriota bacterium]
MAEDDALGLMSIARRDLLAARGMTDATVFHEAVWGFQVQQTIEKALKAWLYLIGVQPPFTHDLVALLKLLEEAGIEIARYRDLARFTDFAVQVRYDDQPDLQNLDRSDWNGRAEALVTVLEAMLPPPALR